MGEIAKMVFEDVTDIRWVVCFIPILVSYKEDDIATLREFRWACFGPTTVENVMDM